MGIENNIERIFAPLHSRLYEIKTGRAKNLTVRPSRLIDPIHKSIGSIPDTEVLTNVDFAIGEISAIDSLTEVSLTQSFEPFERTDPEYNRPITQQELDKYKSQFSELLKEEVSKYQTELVAIKDELVHRIESKQGSKRDKIRLELSVEEIATLFRGLEKTGIIDTKNNPSISQFIAQNFLAKSGAPISPKSLSNKMSTHTESTINSVLAALEKVSYEVNKLKQK